MTPAEVSDAVVAAVRAAADAGELPAPASLDAPVTCVDGVYRTPVALRLGAAAGLPPRQVACAVAAPLARTPGIDRVDVTGPGFLMISLTAPGALVAGVLGAGDSYARPPRPFPRPARTWPDRPRTFANPGFSVRLAYARAAGIARQARDLGVPRLDPPDPGGLGLLGDPRELTLLGMLAELPGRTGQAAREQDPAPVLRHLERLAEAYHDVHERCPALPRGDDEATARHGARCALAEAVRIAMGNALRMVGETPEERI